MIKRVLILMAALCLVAAACGNGSDSSSDGASTGSDQTETADPPAVEPEPTEVPPATPVPDPTPEPTAEPEPTTEPEPTAEPEPAPTVEPEPTQEAEPAGETETVALASGCGAGGSGPALTTESFDFEGRTRTFEQVLPSAYDGETPLPVVLNWHGLGSSGVEQVGFSEYGLLAEVEEFIVIAPTGVPSPGDDSNSWELEPDQDPTRDDLAFANTLLDLVIESLCVDDRRVYTTGMSNGGYFSSVLACEMSERIAAAAAVAALTHADDCDPSRTVPMIGFHGTDDLVVPYAGGGESSLAPGQTVELFLLEIPDEFAEFAIAAGCATEPTVTEVSANVNSYDYPDCPGDIAMTFYEIEGGGHTWPGSLISLAISEAVGLGPTTAEINATETSWAFFEQYALPAE